jgi:hypothetical protein
MPACVSVRARRLRVLPARMRMRVSACAQDPFMMAVRKLGKDEMGPKIVYHEHPLEQGEEFLPDDFLVKVILATASKNVYLFAHNGHFPSLPFASDLHVVVTNT